MGDKLQEKNTNTQTIIELCMEVSFIPLVSFPINCHQLILTAPPLSVSHCLLSTTAAKDIYCGFAGHGVIGTDH